MRYAEELHDAARSTKRNLLAGALAVLVFGWAGAPAFAQSRPANAKLLIAPLPAGIDQAGLLKITAMALTERGWTVVETTDDQVSGRIERLGYDARLRIFVADNALQYVEDTKRLQNEGWGRTSMKQIETPENWMGFLRKSIMARIATVERKPAPAPVPDATTRLQSLKELLDKGLITQPEYEQKRAEILKSL
jgi:hypothetical protein